MPNIAEYDNIISQVFVNFNIKMKFYPPFLFLFVLFAADAQNITPF